MVSHWQHSISIQQLSLVISTDASVVTKTEERVRIQGAEYL